MKLLIVYYSQTGNTQRVAEMITEHTKKASTEVVCKDVSTVTEADVTEADSIIVGTPVHGLMLFGQKTSKPIREFVNSLSDNLQQKKFFLFATYLLFPSKALSGINKTIQQKQGELVASVAMHRKKKEELAQAVYGLLST